MSVVIITGSSGLVGSESVEFFCKKGFDVVGIDNNLRNHFFGKDGSTIWVKKKLLNKHKNFKSNNIEILTLLKKFLKNIKKIFPLSFIVRHSHLMIMERNFQY